MKEIRPCSERKSEGKKELNVSGVGRNNTEKWLILFFNHATNPIIKQRNTNATFSGRTKSSLFNSLPSSEESKQS